VFETTQHFEVQNTVEGFAFALETASACLKGDFFFFAKESEHT